MKEEFYAHSREGTPPENWHRLEDHLKAVAEMAQKFANEFNAGDWGYQEGLWHDIGKYSWEFQKRLVDVSDPDTHIETKAGRPDHPIGRQLSKGPGLITICDFESGNGRDRGDV